MDRRSFLRFLSVAPAATVLSGAFEADAATPPAKEAPQPEPLPRSWASLSVSLQEVSEKPKGACLFTFDFDDYTTDGPGIEGLMAENIHGEQELTPASVFGSRPVAANMILRGDLELAVSDPTELITKWREGPGYVRLKGRGMDGFFLVTRFDLSPRP